MNGPTVTSVTSNLGITDVQSSTHITTANISTTIYCTTRFTNFIKISVTGSTVGSAAFSITVPVTHFMSTSTIGLLDYNTWTAKLNPGFIVIDNTAKVIEHIEFGLNDVNYDLDAYKTTYFLASSLLAVVESASNIVLLDATATNAACTNCYKNNSWIQYKHSAATPKVGETYTTGAPDPIFVFRSNCETCAAWGSPNFGASIICGSWDFFAHSSFSVANNASDDTNKIAKVYYQNPTDATKSRYCLYIPNIGKSTTCSGNYCNPGTGSSNTDNPDMEITAFGVPVDGGLKWPVDMVSVMSETKTLKYLQMDSLSYNFTPNTITINSKESTL